MRIVVTDLTRFSNKDLLCLAGLTEDGQTCIRPMRSVRPSYLTYQECKKLNVLPGSILEGDFKVPPNIEPPHVEDRHFSGMKVVGSASSNEFRKVLQASAYKSVSEAFACDVPAASKVLENAPEKSIVTLQLDPNVFDVVQSTQFKPEKVTAHLVDDDGLSLRFLSITDLGFFDHVGRAATRTTTADKITEFIHGQDELFIRLGLGRRYKSPDGRDGYWMQVNGIYTFPDYDHLVRSY